MHTAPATTLPPAAPREPRTLPIAREAFVAAVRRDTPGTDLPRYVEALDALLAWSTARPTALAFRPDAAAGGGISFGRVGTKGVFWSVRPVRGAAPMLEIAPPAGTALTEEARARAVATLNAHSRAVLAAATACASGSARSRTRPRAPRCWRLLDEFLAAAPGADGADGAAPAQGS
jgi:hypothetical protein